MERIAFSRGLSQLRVVAGCSVLAVRTLMSIIKCIGCLAGVSTSTTHIN